MHVATSRTSHYWFCILFKKFEIFEQFGATNSRKTIQKI